MKILELLKLLAETPGKNDKVALIAEHGNNPVASGVLYYAYSPKFIYGIKKHPLQEPAIDAGDFETEEDLNRLVAVLEALHNREYTGNSAKRILSNLLASYNTESQELILNVIKHDLRGGFSSSTINKAIPDLVELEPPYQRCSLLAGANFDDFGDQFYSQLKADGMYLNLYLDDGKVSATTRAGNEFPLIRFGSWYNRMVEASRGIHASISGEVVMKEDGEFLERATSNGITNKIMKEGDIDFDRYDIHFFAWDMIPLSEFKNKGKYHCPYSERLNQLNAYTSSRGITNLIEVIETRVVNSYEEAIEHYNECRLRKQEGTVIKSMDAPWIDGTSKLQIKMKAEVEIDLEIVDLKPGEGKNAKTFGSILMRSSCGGLECFVSGISDELRQEIFENFESYRGTITTVTSNALTESRKAKKNQDPEPRRLFLPRWKIHRPDKNTADSLDRIIQIFDSKL